MSRFNNDYLQTAHNFHDTLKKLLRSVLTSPAKNTKHSDTKRYTKSDTPHKKRQKMDSLQDLPPRNIEKTLETFDESTDSEVDPTPFISTQIDKIPKEKT